MVEFTISVTINQQRQTVVKAFFNPANMIFWTKDLEKFEIIKKKPGEIGAVIQLYYLQNNKSYIMKDELIACEPGFAYLSKISADDLTAMVETSFIEQGKNTEIVMKWSGRGNSTYMNLSLYILKSKIAKQAKRELNIFKNLVETRGSDFDIFHHKIG